MIDFCSGVTKVNVDLESQVVKILGSLAVEEMAASLEQIGLQARLIGQGNPEGELKFNQIVLYFCTKLLRFAQLII